MTTTVESVVEVEARDGGVAVVRMNRPERLNALNPALIQGLNDYFADFKRGSYQTRAIVFTGAGRAFCAGGDFSPRDPDAEPDPWRRGHPEVEVVSFMRDCDAPIIGAINGYAMGGGFSLAMACDLRIAADDAVFQVAQMKRGIVPEYGLSYFLQEQLGRQRALELILTARRIDAQEALDLGLVLEVVPSDDLEARAVEFATEIASGPPLGMAASKRMINVVEQDAFSRVQELSQAYNRQLGATEDGAEGVNSFLERREPQFQGR